MSKSIKSRYILYAAAVTLCIPFDAKAYSPPLSSEKVMEHQQKVSYLSFGTRLGEETVEGYIDLIYPLFATPSNTFFFTPRFSLKDEGANEANIGLGYRRKLTDWLVGGINIYFDSRESEHSNRFNQWGAGLEFFSEYVDVRANYYDADNDKKCIGEYSQRVTETSTQLSYKNKVFATGHEVVFEKVRIERTTTTVTGSFFEQFETGMDGWDAEIGGKLPLPKGPEIRLFAGYYDYDNTLGDDFSGGKGRLEVRTGSWLSLDAEVFEDKDFNDTNYFVGFRLQVPLSSALSWQGLKEGLFSSQHRDLDRRMRSEMVVRDVRIQTEDSDWQEDLTRRQVQHRVSEKRSASRIVLADHITFVDGDTSGPADGTNERPYKKIQDGVDNAGVNNIIFVYETGGTATGKPVAGDGGGAYDEQVVLQEGQTLTSTVSWSDNGGGSYQTKQRPMIRPTAVTNEEETGISEGNTYFAAPVISMAADATVRRMAVDATAPGFVTYHTDWYHRTPGIYSDQRGADNTGLAIEESTIVASGDEAYGIYINADHSTGFTSTIANNSITTSGYRAAGISIAGSYSTGLASTIADNSIIVTISESLPYYHYFFTTFVDAGGSTGLTSTIENNSITTDGDYAGGIYIYAIDSTGLTSTIVNNAFSSIGGYMIGVNISFSGDPINISSIIENTRSL